MQSSVQMNKCRMVALVRVGLIHWRLEQAKGYRTSSRSSRDQAQLERCAFLTADAQILAYDVQVVWGGRGVRAFLRYAAPHVAFVEPPPPRQAS
jgi:hypothetical protein